MLARLMERMLVRDSGEARTAASGAVLASCALLLEMAASDGEFSAAEREIVLAILEREHGLSAADGLEMLELAEAERRKSVDLWSFTSQLNRELDQPAKLRLIETIWQVIYADERLNGHEDYLVHRLAELLNLRHADLIAAKLKVLKG